MQYNSAREMRSVKAQRAHEDGPSRAAGDEEPGMRILQKASPRAILVATFLAFLGPVVLLELFPAQLDRVMEHSTYLVFHNAAEAFGILVSLSVFSVGWFTYDQSKDRHALFLGTAFLAVGLLDFMHTLSNVAMPAFLTPNTTNKSTQFWVAARLVNAAAFVVSASVYPETRRWWLSKTGLLAAALSVTGLLFVGIVYFPSHLPATAVPETGLTPLKRYLELLAVLLFAAAAAGYWRRMKATGDRSLLAYPAALVICMFSEILFASYATGFDAHNVVGHLYKIAAFTLIYGGIYAASVRRPYESLLDAHGRLLEESISRSVLEEEVGERRQVEAALRASEAKYRSLFENMIDGIALHRIETDEAGRPVDYTFLEANPVFERLTGLKVGEIVGRTATQVLPGIEQDPADWIGTYGRVALTGEEKRFEQYSAPLGRWYYVTAYSPAPRHFATIFEDITDRKRAEERARASELQNRHLASFPQANPNPVLEIDAFGRLIFANPAAERVLETLGLGREGFRALLPDDLQAIAREGDGGREASIVREVPVGGAVFRETIQHLPQYGVVRIYAYDVTERTRAEESLRKAHDELEERVLERTRELRAATAAVIAERQRFYDVLELLPAYVVLLSPDHRVPFANKFFRDRFGESSGRRCYEYLFGRTEPCEVCETFTVLKTGTPHHWEWDGPDGRTYDINDYPYRDRDGSSLIMEVGIDITERKRAEQDLRKAKEGLELRVAERTVALWESEERLRLAVEATDLGTWDLNPITGARNWDARCKTLFGLPPEAAVDPDAIFSGLHPDDRERVRTAVQHALDPAGAGTFDVEFRMLRDGAGVSWLRSTGRAFFNDRGRATRFTGTVQDVTGRKSAEERILRQNVVLNGINRIFREALVAKTDDEIGRACLSVAEEVTGSRFGFIGEIGPDGLLHDIAISDPGWELCTIHPRSGHGRPSGDFKIRGLYGRVLIEGRSFFSNHPGSHPDRVGLPAGHPALTSFLGVPLTLGGSPFGMVAVANREGGYTAEVLASLEALAPAVVEALHRVRAEQKLAASLREKDILLREVHHRVKNNMQVISSLVSLQADTVSDPALVGQLADVRDRVRSLALVHEKLYLSGGLADLDFSDYADGLLQYLWRAHGQAAAHIRLDKQLQPLTLAVEDAVHCGLILTELVTNALKHGFAGRAAGEVSVGIQAGDQSGSIRLWVRDNGVGMPLGLDWRQTHSLGLRLVGLLVEQMHGTLEVGGPPGTEFRVTFPASRSGEGGRGEGEE
jgi:PAS domain S-box-containing protein